MVRTVALFQSTLPGWGATGDMFHRFFDDRDISIHAPRMGSDHGHQPVIYQRRYFNPRSPDGERRLFYWLSEIHNQDFNPRSPDGERLDFSHDIVNTPYQFQSTLPGWGATTQARETRDKQSISIHAPRMGSDNKPRHSTTRNNGFQSTLPGWGATAYLSMSMSWT